jgi:hypothetical protein
VFANEDAAETWLQENDPEGVAFEDEVPGDFLSAVGEYVTRHLVSSGDHISTPPK